MKNIFKILLLCLLLIPNLYGQDGMNLPLSVVIPEDVDYTVSSRYYLKTKLQQYIAEEAIGEIAEDYSFMVYPRIAILNQEITSGTPQLHVVELDLALFISSGQSLKSVKEGEKESTQGLKQILFNSKSFTLKGVGQSKEKALFNAFQNIDKQKNALKEFFKTSRYKIFIYFKENCDAMIKEAEILAKEGSLSFNTTDANSSSISKEKRSENKFMTGISILKNLRIANTQCYESKTDKINEILNMYDEFACNYYFSLAKNYWAKRDTRNTINNLNQIPPSRKCKTEMEAFLNEIGKYVDSHDHETIDNKIKLWKEAGGLDKARIDGEAYKYLESSSLEIRRIQAQSVTNKDLMILK